MLTIAIVAAITAAALLLFATALTLLPRAGAAGRRLAGWCAAAPLLDVVVALLTWVPWAVATPAAGWRGFVGAVAGQVVAAIIWVAGHEVAHRDAVRGPRLVKAHNRIVGRLRNHGALWFTLVVLPVFWAVRAAEILLYPPLRRLMGFPAYRHGEWINVSRHKFDGLVGHDLLWCLYCDWMTGVYALGGEMLRNVESFWCPIRFADPAKCANCRVDFPDVADGWVPADGTMADAERTVLERYGDAQRGWFGHPARLTVRGEEVPIRA